MGNPIVILPLRALISAILVTGIIFFSTFPVGLEPTDGMLRLAWRAVAEKVRICKQKTEEEQQKSLRHMRLPQACHERLVAYRLTVAIGGEEVINRAVIPPGIHNDRPLFVQEDIKLPTGSHPLKITFLPMTAEETDNMGFGEMVDSDMAIFRESLAKSYHYILEREIEIKTGQIILVDLDEDDRSFIFIGT